MTAKEANIKAHQNYQGDDYDFVISLIENKVTIGEFELIHAGTISQKTCGRLIHDKFTVQVIGWKKGEKVNKISWYD